MGRTLTRHIILFLAANPLGTDRLALDEEARAIQQELERSGHRDRFELVTRWAARPLDLLRELRKLEPTVVHFSGHGSGGGAPRAGAGPGRDLVAEPDTVDAAQAPGLYFQGADGRPQLVSTAALEETFGAAGASVKLVVLSACYSEQQVEALLAHVGAVVGMRGSIRDDAARHFAIGFYGGLGERQTIAAAYRQGRAAIRLAGLADGDQPQLRVRDGERAEQLALAAEPPGGAAAAAARPPPARARARGELIVVENNYGRIIVGDSYPKLILRAAITGLVAGMVLLLGRDSLPAAVAWVAAVAAWLFRKREPQQVRATGGGPVARSILGLGVAAAAAVGSVAAGELLPRTAEFDLAALPPPPAPPPARAPKPARTDRIASPELAPQVDDGGRAADTATPRPRSPLQPAVRSDPALPGGARTPGDRSFDRALAAVLGDVATAECELLEASATSAGTPALDAELVPLETKLRKPPFSGWNQFKFLSRSQKVLAKGKTEQIRLELGSATATLVESVGWSKVRLTVTMNDALGMQVADNTATFDAGDHVIYAHPLPGNDGHLLAVSCK